MNVFTSILLILFGGFLGYLGNRYANKQSEDRIINTLTAEIQSLKDKQQTARLTPDEQQRIQILQAQINILKQK